MGLLSYTRLPSLVVLIAVLYYWKPTASVSLLVAGPKISSSHSANNFDITGYEDQLYRPILHNITEPFIADGTQYNLSNQPRFKTSVSERICILDVDTRPNDQPNQLWSEDHPFNWSKVGGQTPGLLSHYIYAKIHGYKYRFFRGNPYPERNHAWARLPAIVSALTECEIVVYMDSDAIFPHMNLPIEWLINYWNITQDIAFAMAQEPFQWLSKRLNVTQDSLPHPEPLRSWVSGLDSGGRTALNAGVMIVQRTPDTLEMMRRWAKCPVGGYPGCEKLTMNWPAEQGAFTEYVRYDFPDRVRELPCDEALGYPGISIGCSGRLMRHYTSEEGTIRDVMGKILLERIMGSVQESMLLGRDELLMHDVEYTVLQAPTR